MLGELDGSPDAFYQRTRMRLEQLDAKLLEWGKTGEPARVIETLRDAHRRDLPQAARERSGPGELREVPQPARESHSGRVIAYFTAARSSSLRPAMTSSG